MIWTHQQIQQALSEKVKVTEDLGALQFNSKDVNKGDIFIALNIGSRDGHHFVADAIERGAVIAIVSQYVQGVDINKLVKVDDTFTALNLLAEYKRINSNAKFIGVTGSVGKTSTKESLGIMLGAYGKVFVSRGNFNNYLGVPINLASMPDDVDYAIIEMGMSAPGELGELSKMVTPDIAIITSVSEGHLAFFKSVEDINDAKCEIFHGLKLASGIAVINADIKTYQRCVENIDRMGIQNIYTFGKDNQADVQFTSYELLEENQVRLGYLVLDEEIEIIMPAIPEHLASNFAACFATISALGLDIDPASEAIVNFTPTPGRGAVISVGKNNKNYTLICDYYNSNPESLKAALKHLAQFDNKHKIAVIGDMRELGEDEVQLHKDIAPCIVESGATKVILIGDLMGNLQDELPKDIEVICYTDVDQCLLHIEEDIIDGTTMLIKASRSIKLDKIAKYLGVADVL